MSFMVAGAVTKVISVASIRTAAHETEAQLRDDDDLGDGEGEEDHQHYGGRSENHQAGAAEGVHDGLGHVARLVITLAVATEDEDEVVHGYAEESAEQEDGDVGVDSLIFSGRNPRCGHPGTRRPPVRTRRRPRAG